MDLLVKEEGVWVPAAPVGFQTEADFQDLVQQTFERTLASQGDRPAVIAREVSTPEGGRIDVVAVDQDGVLTLCECKLDRNAGSRREVLGQVLEYGGSLHGMKFGDFRRLISDRLDTDLMDAMRERAGDDFDPVAWKDAVARSLTAGSFRLVIAVDQLTDVLKQTVLYLNDRASFSVVVAELRRVAHDGIDVLAPSLFGEEAAQRKLPRRSTSPTVRDADTVIVAAKIAYPEFQRLGAYVCQPKRSFRDGVRFFGFYSERTVHPEFPAIVERRFDLPFTRGEVERLRRGDERDRQVADVMEGALSGPVGRDEGERHQVVLLDLASGFTLDHAIRHEGSGAWTQGQRYSKSGALKTEPMTTDDLAVEEG